MGLVFNIRYTEIFDFLLGWYGLDIAGDDNGQRSHWPWQDATARNAPWRPELEF